LTDGLIAVSEDMGLAEMFPNRFYGMVTGPKTCGEFPVAACPETRYAITDDRRKYEIVQSIRTLTLLRQEHPDKRRGGRLHFRTPAEMAGGCQEHPDWLRHTFEIAERCNFVFPFGKPQFPAFAPPDGSPPSD
jgi:DNA polymerase-3 subunit alpha